MDDHRPLLRTVRNRRDPRGGLYRIDPCQRCGMPWPEVLLKPECPVHRPWKLAR